MHGARRSLLCLPAACIVTVVIGAACAGSSDNGSRPDPGTPAGPCTFEEHLGGFEIALNDGFTSVQGQVSNGVTPLRIPELDETVGDCTLYRPPNLFCDPACESGTTCDRDGECVDSPGAMSVGNVTVEGLKGAVQMSGRAPVFFYTHLGELEHPGFDEGDAIALTAAGDGDVAPFYLDALGVAPLEGLPATAALEQGQAVSVGWTPPGDSTVSSIHLNLNIAQHGGTPGRVECHVEDNGQFEIPVQLSDALLDSGFSGFPTLAVTRHSVDSTDLAQGCTQLAVQSVRVLEVVIPGLTSCSDDDDCDDPETCQPDLTCG